jgi:hypothetical protein
MEVSCTTSEALIARDFQVMRQQRFVYAHKIGDTLAKELNEYHASNNDAMDLSSEMSLLRMQVGEALSKFEAWRNFKPLPEQAAQYPPQTIELFVLAAQAELNVAIARVQELAIAMSKIQAARNGKLDQIMLQSIASNLAMQVDYAIQEFTHTDNSNERAGLLANRVNDLLSGAFDSIKAGSGDVRSMGDGVSAGPVVATIPARQTAEEILKAMMATVPMYNEDVDSANVFDDASTLEDEDTKLEQNKPIEVVPIKTA